MTSRFPLTINTGSATVEELPASIDLDLASSNIVNAGEITADTFIGDGSQLTGIIPVAAGNANEIQYSFDGELAASPSLTFDDTTTTLTANNFIATSTANLGDVGNVVITGGTTGQVLTTNGSGTLSWSTSSGGGGSSGLEQTFLFMGS